MKQGIAKWDIVESPVYGANGVQSQNYKQILRGDTMQELAIVSDTYKPISNASFFDTISEIAKTSGYEYQGYEELFGGNRLLAWLKNPQPQNLCGYKTDSYLMFGTAHDGTSALMVGTTNFMVRCQNQFTAPHKNNIFKIAHTKTSTVKVNNLAQSFAKYQTVSNLMYAQIERFADVKVDSKMISTIIKAITNEGQKQKVTPYLQKVQNDMFTSIHKETNDLGKTLFGVFNGLTHYATHHGNNHRGKETVFGNAHGKMASINKKAFELCAELYANAPKTYSLQ
jgi:Domain of unknown function (DUF932)